MAPDYQHLEAPGGAEYAKDLRGIGINLLSSDVKEMARFLTEIMGLTATWVDEDFAIIRHEGMEFMVHSDAAYAENPLLSLTGDGIVRGAGVEIRLYDVDPDHTTELARRNDYHILQEATSKGHGLREAYIIGPDGYCWVPSKPVGLS